MYDKIEKFLDSIFGRGCYWTADVVNHIEPMYPTPGGYLEVKLEIGELTNEMYSTLGKLNFDGDISGYSIDIHIDNSIGVRYHSIDMIIPFDRLNNPIKKFVKFSLKSHTF